MWKTIPGEGGLKSGTSDFVCPRGSWRQNFWFRMPRGRWRTGGGDLKTFHRKHWIRFRTWSPPLLLDCRELREPARLPDPSYWYSRTLSYGGALGSSSASPIRSSMKSPTCGYFPVRADTGVAPVMHRFWRSYNTKHVKMKHSVILSHTASPISYMWSFKRGLNCAAWEWPFKRGVTVLRENERLNEVWLYCVRVTVQTRSNCTAWEWPFKQGLTVLRESDRSNKVWLYCVRLDRSSKVWLYCVRVTVQTRSNCTAWEWPFKQGVTVLRESDRSNKVWLYCVRVTVQTRSNCTAWEWPFKQGVTVLRESDRSNKVWLYCVRVTVQTRCDCTA